MHQLMTLPQIGLVRRAPGPGEGEVTMNYQINMSELL